MAQKMHSGKFYKIKIAKRLILNAIVRKKVEIDLDGVDGVLEQRKREKCGNLGVRSWIQ